MRCVKGKSARFNLRQADAVHRTGEVLREIQVFFLLPFSLSFTWFETNDLSWGSNNLDRQVTLPEFQGCLD